MPQKGHDYFFFFNKPNPISEVKKIPSAPGPNIRGNTLTGMWDPTMAPHSMGHFVSLFYSRSPES